MAETTAATARAEVAFKNVARASRKLNIALDLLWRMMHQGIRFDAPIKPSCEAGATMTEG
jgi:hypothetical protein